MKDKFSKKANYEEIKYDLVAVEFHADRFKIGDRDPLAIACNAHIESVQNKVSEKK